MRHKEICWNFNELCLYAHRDKKSLKKGFWLYRVRAVLELDLMPTLTLNNFMLVFLMISPTMALCLVLEMGLLRWIY